MPIEYKILHDRRLIVARCLGILGDADVSAYQREAWSKPEVQGYNELADMAGVEQIELPSFARMKQMASLASRMDAPTTAKFAIVAVTDVQFGLAQMYAGWRNADPRTTKQVSVFRSLKEALNWLGVKDLSDGGPTPSDRDWRKPTTGIE